MSFSSVNQLVHINVGLCILVSHENLHQLLVLHVEAVDVGLQLVVVLDEELFSLARGLLLQGLVCPAPLHPLPLLCSLVRCLGSGSGFGLYMGFGLSKRVCFVLLRCEFLVIGSIVW